jgi:PKD repeat protein
MIFFARFSIFSQEVYYQNTIQGGVSVVGMSTADGYGFQSFNINIPDNSEILEVFLISHSTLGFDYEMLNYQCAVNGQIIDIVADSDFFYVVENNIVPFYIKGHKIYIKKISEAIGSISNNISIDWMLPSGTGNSSCPGCRISSPYLVIVYENENLPVINLSIIVNQNPNQYSGIINLDGLNPVDLNFDVGLSIHCDRIGGNPNDGYEFFLDGTSVGVVNEPDITSLVGGVIGTFEYYNGTLFGLTDDVPNDTFSGSDAILRLNNYMTGSSLNGMQLTYNYLVPPNSPHNYFNTICLAYTSPCQPFSHSLLTADTLTCVNSPLQLGASGGIAYNWLPQTNLSCYDCPNPIFTGDSTINYTVRIWSTDSCSVVQPVRVRVVRQPNFENINVTENICGYEVGAIVGASTGLSLPHSFQINNSTPQNNFNFSNLEAGIYTITLSDANGCSRDSTVQILEINNVQAAFSVNPNSGAAPLTVQTQNNSQNATEYQWFWGDESSTLQNPSISLDTAGVYSLTLVASNGAAHCNDTTSALIFVEEPFVVFAYSYVTDEADVYQIFLSGVSEYHYDLYALDGKLVYQKSGNVEAAGYVDLWEISGVSSGMYVFRVMVKDNAGNEQEVEGKVVVVR